MATQKSTKTKTSEKESTKPTKAASKTSASKTTKTSAKAAPKAAKSMAKAAPKAVKSTTTKATNTPEITTPDVDLLAKIEYLTSEVEKLRSELNIMKQFKNNANNQSPSEKIYIELDKIREQLFNCEDRLEELEYQVSEKEDY